MKANLRHPGHFSVFPFSHCDFFLPLQLFTLTFVPSSQPSCIFQSKHFSPCQSSCRLLPLFSLLSSSVPPHSSGCPYLLSPASPIPSSLFCTARPASPLSTILSASYVGYLRGDQAGAGFFFFFSNSHSPLFCLPYFTALHCFSKSLQVFPFIFSSDLSLFLFLPACAFRGCHSAVFRTVENQDRAPQQMLAIRWRQESELCHAAADVPHLYNWTLDSGPLHLLLFDHWPLCPLSWMWMSVLQVDPDSLSTSVYRLGYSLL